MREGQGAGIDIRCLGSRTIAICEASVSSSPTFALARMRDLAFVRSPVAHARILAVRKPTGHEDQSSSPPT